jgi:hypothetical protein
MNFSFPPIIVYNTHCPGQERISIECASYHLDIWGNVKTFSFLVIFNMDTKQGEGFLSFLVPSSGPMTVQTNYP